MHTQRPHVLRAESNRCVTAVQQQNKAEEQKGKLESAKESVVGNPRRIYTVTKVSQGTRKPRWAWFSLSTAK